MMFRTETKTLLYLNFIIKAGKVDPLTSVNLYLVDRDVRVCVSAVNPPPPPSPGVLHVKYSKH